MTRGVDFAFSPHPAIADLAANGVKFAGRYMSPSAANDGNGKNLLAGELAALHAAGLSVIVVEESAADRMLGGHPAGVADAQHGDAVTRALGMAGMPVYFACDFDAAASQQPAIAAYLQGAASVIGVKRTGVYGGYWPLHRAFDAGLVSYGWQTYAWSAAVGAQPPDTVRVDVGGNQFWFDTRAQVRQLVAVTIGSVRVDGDEAVAADYGQWPRPAAPVPAPPPPVTAAPGGISTTVAPQLRAGWGAISTDYYRYQVCRGSAASLGPLVASELVTGNHASIALPGPGAYTMRVQGRNAPWTAWHDFTA